MTRYLLSFLAYPEIGRGEGGFVMGGGGGFQNYFFDIFHLLAPVCIYTQKISFLAYPEDTIPGDNG